MKEATDYGSRLKALKQEQQRLERKQAELLDKRRVEIGKLVERLGLLEADDDALAGALLELKDAFSKTGDERLARWRAAGASFRRKDANRKAAPSRAGAGLAQSAAHLRHHGAHDLVADGGMGIREAVERFIVQIGNPARSHRLSRH